MAVIKQCDKCGTTTNIDALITINRKRILYHPHDGEYIRKVQADYDLCEKCAREIELFFISEEKADAKIFV